MSAESLLATWPVPNAAAVVVGNGEILAEYGDQQQVFRLASVTKPIAALAALVALEEGVYELDDPAGPEGSTMRHLLAHASGLDVSTTKVIAPPGYRRIYSSPGFHALGAAIADKSGIPFPEYATDAVVRPLGMTGTTIEGPSGMPGDGATATTADLAKFAAELQRPRLIDASTLAVATAPVFPDLDGVLPGYGRQTPNPWGLGLEIRGRKSPHWTGAANSTRTFGHFGQSGTFLWVDPEYGLAAVALTDRDFGPWATEVWPAFSDAVLTEFA